MIEIWFFVVDVVVGSYGCFFDCWYVLWFCMCLL